MKLAIIFLFITSLALGQQIIVENGTVTPGITYKSMTIVVQDSTRVIQPFSGPQSANHYLTTWQPAIGDTSTYTMTTTFLRRKWDAPQKYEAGLFTTSTACTAVKQGVTIAGCLNATTYVHYNWDMATKKTKVTVTYAKKENTTGKIQIRNGSITGPILAEFETTSTGGWGDSLSEWKDVEATLKTSLPVGPTIIYMTFTGGLATGNANVKWIELK